MIKYLNKLFDLAGYDGLKHVLLSMIITKVLLMFLPIWVAIVIAVIISLSKELYDYLSKKGVADIKDMFCNIIGIILAVC